MVTHNIGRKHKQGYIWCFILPEIIGDAVQGDDVKGVWQERSHISAESPNN